MSDDATLNEFIDNSGDSTESGSATEDYQDTGDLQTLETSPIEDWKLVRIDDILSFEYGDNLPANTRREGSIPVYGSNGQVDTHTEANVDSEGIIIGRKGSIGKGEFSDKPFWAIDTTYYISDEETDENLRFIYYLLQDMELERLNAASAIPGLNRNDAYNLNTLVPPLSEQRKIATVLHTVDQAIQKTGEIVEQVERIEQGLLQDLFSGEYLDCEYQTESTLGRIPEHWDALPMSEVCNITMGSSPKSEYYNESGDGLPFFQANNEFGLRNPTNDRWCSNPVKTAKKGDSLMTIRGTYVGQMNIADKECCIGRGLAGISAGDKLDSEYLYHHLRRRERYVKSIAIGSTFDSVSSGDLENLLIAVPPEDEQKQIADILQRVQQRIIFSEKYLDRLSSLKKGLMQDLLSGKVRTTDANIHIPDEVAQYG